MKALDIYYFHILQFKNIYMWIWLIVRTYLLAPSVHVTLHRKVDMYSKILIDKEDIPSTLPISMVFFILVLAW